MMTFRLQCPKCKLKCVTYPDEIVEQKSADVECYFCKHQWKLFGDEFISFIAPVVLEKFVASQEPLGEPFASVLYDNLDSLYIRS